MEFITVTVDKSHIITIGEKLYTESIEFIRELVNNAYDADATLVDIIITDDAIEIRDNGAGMDREGLMQYFNIGSQYKLKESHSPVYNRTRIGQFGIGKFASLAACKRFEIITKKKEFVARVIFDKDEWGRAKDLWQIPMEILQPDFRIEDGTTVILIGLSRRYDLKDIESKIIEGTPLKVPHFRVRLNSHPITPRSLTGHRMPFLEGTPFGVVNGEIIILPETAATKDDVGIEIKVKQVTVRREYFGMETWGKVMARVRGEVNADFLHVTSDRTGFVKDSPEYMEFEKVMAKLMEDVKAVIKKVTAKREGRIVSRAMGEALQRVYKSLVRNPDFSPFGVLPIAGEGEGIGGAAATSSGKGAKEGEVKTQKGAAPEKPKKQRKKKAKVRELTPNAVIKRLKFGDVGVSCVVDSYGEDGPEVFSEGTVIYINRDHPLYSREAKKFDTHMLNLVRLITQEISMMNDPRSPRQAFERQSRLLRDAFMLDSVDDKKV